jgi:PAS domain S-box-containing protein
MHNPTENNRHDLGPAHHSGAIVYSYDLNGNITFLNHEGERLSGYTSEEACRMKLRK